MISQFVSKNIFFYRKNVKKIEKIRKICLRKTGGIVFYRAFAHITFIWILYGMLDPYKKHNSYSRVHSFRAQ